MASDSVLTIVRETCGRIGLNKPSTATGSTDVQVQQLVSLVNEEGKKLASRTRWQELIAEATFVTVAAEDQGKLSGTIVATASGFKYVINDTIFNRTQKVNVPGPLSPSGWQVLKSTGSVAGFWSQYRIRGGRLLMYPAPAAGQTASFEYVTENWVSNAANDTFRKAFTADDDYPLLDSDLLTAGLVWRWKKAKGLSYGEDMTDYEELVNDAMTRNASARTVNLNGACEEATPYVVVSRANWPL